MLNLFGNDHRTCDGMNRRNFLSVGALGALGGLSMISLPDLLRARAEAQAQGRATQDTSVVWLWLGGGATHVETFDPKMTAPAEFRSTVGAVQTNLAGVQIGGLLPRIGTVADKMAFVRSFAHGTGSHGAGTYWVNTGYASRNNEGAGAQAHPSSGSILSRSRGTNHPRTGVPTYVRLGNITGDGAAWLGRAYEPFATSGQARLNMEPRVTVEQLQDRRALSQAFDSVNREIDSTGMLDGLDQYGRQAYELVQGNARQAFDTTRENARTREQYGRGLGVQMLLARRLCEAGCGFVTINYGGWDMHGQIANALRRRCGELDQAVSAFVRDTVDRGLDRKILLVITGEFGRTPRINRNAGRDHWGSLCTLALAGGGLRMGQTVGESSSKVERPATAPIAPIDLKATVLHALGLPRDLQFTSPLGRPTYMIEGGRAIRELVA
ncbi:MAG: DUF1501 domain-containing protein [Planctomycetes bacterium]|nr:DUF1501 domain-containing protein [Planctomycetota bacterium]